MSISMTSSRMKDDIERKYGAILAQDGYNPALLKAFLKYNTYYMYATNNESRQEKENGIKFYRDIKSGFFYKLDRSFDVIRMRVKPEKEEEANDNPFPYTIPNLDQAEAVSFGIKSGREPKIHCFRVNKNGLYLEKITEGGISTSFYDSHSIVNHSSILNSKGESIITNPAETLYWIIENEFDGSDPLRISEDELNGHYGLYPDLNFVLTHRGKEYFGAGPFNLQIKDNGDVCFSQGFNKYYSTDDIYTTYFKFMQEQERYLEREHPLQIKRR